MQFKTGLSWHIDTNELKLYTAYKHIILKLDIQFYYKRVSKELKYMEFQRLCELLAMTR